MAEFPQWPEHIAALRDEVLTPILPRLTSTAPSVRGLAAAFAYEQVWSRPGLSQRDRSIVTISAVAAINCPEELKLHVLQGMANGLTKEEIGEILTQLIPYIGFPTVVSAAVAVSDVVERAQRNDPATTGSHETSE